MSLRINTLWNLAGSGLPLIAAIALIPYLLNLMGNESFGILTLIWALVGYLSLFDLGIGRSLTYQISKSKNSADPSEIAVTLMAGLILTLLTGTLGAISLWYFSPLFVKWLNVSVEFQNDAVNAFKLCAIAIIPTVITSGFRGALEGFERFAASNLSKMIVGFSMFVLPAIAIKIHGTSLSVIALYLCLMRVAIAFLLVWQILPYLKNCQSKFTKRHFTQLFDYGFWLTISGIVGPLMVYGDRFFVSVLVGAALLPYYAIPQEGLFRMLIIPSAICSALLPKLTALKGNDFVVYYDKNAKKLIKLMLLLCLLASVLTYPVLYFWLSPTFADKSMAIVFILIIGVFVNGISMFPYTFLHAKAKTKLTAIFHIIELCIYVPLIWIFTHKFGLIGAALAWLVRVTLDYTLLQITVNKFIKKSYRPSTLKFDN